MRKNIFICIIFAVSISACTEELDKEINIETNSSLYDLSESEALTIAKTFHESVTSEPQTRDNNTAFGVKSTYRLHASEKTRALSSEELPLVYEIEINNGLENGRIIVSGDKRFQEVLAYMPSFNDSLYQVSLGPNIMMQMAKNTLLDKIQNYKNALSTRSYPVDPIPGVAPNGHKVHHTIVYYPKHGYNMLKESEVDRDQHGMITIIQEKRL